MNNEVTVKHSAEHLVEETAKFSVLGALVTGLIVSIAVLV